MRNKPGRIIIDTNLFISFLISHNTSKLDEILFSGEWILIFSDESLQELVEVMRRPKFHRLFSPSDIQELLIVLFRNSPIVEVYSNVNICRDPKDNFLLGLAHDEKADVLLTGDNDLLVLKKFGDTEIMTISEFAIFK